MLNSRLLLNIFLSLAISLFLIALLISGIDGTAEPGIRTKLFSILAQTTWNALLLYMLASIVQAFFRAIRYQVLLKSSLKNDEELPSLLHLFMVTMSRNMFTDMLPARLGELSYVAMLNLGFKVRADACLSSLALSFVFDLIALALLILAMIGYQVFVSGVEIWLVVVFVILLVICGLLFFFLFPFLKKVSEYLSRKFSTAGRSGRFFENVRGKTIRLMNNTSTSLHYAAQQRVIGQVLVLSLGVRIAKYSGLYLLFCGVVSGSFTHITKDLIEVSIALISAEAGAGLPIPTFMSFGTYEAAGTFALVALGVSKASSVLVMLALHIWSQLIDYAFGIGATVLFALSVIDLKHLFEKNSSCSTRKGLQNLKAGQGKNRTVFFCALIFFLGGAFFFGFQFWKIHKTGWLHRSSSENSLSLVSTAARQTNPVFDELQGFAIWSSNRMGNYDLVMLTFPELQMSFLTTSPNAESFPKISPNGNKILFCRSQQPEGLAKNKLVWDIWILNLSTGSTQLLARNALTPTWSDDGEKVYFVRQASQFVEYTLANQKEIVVFETGKDFPLNASIHLETPTWNENRQALAVTLRGGAQGTFIINKDKSIQQVGKGCQLNWAPDASFLYLVDDTKTGDNAFLTVNPVTLEQKLLFDAPGAFSHEYFPKISNTGGMLVYGASTVGNEEDQADYEIFLWPIGTPMGNTARLSFHTGNDNWPDIYLY
jgi:uncharacterized membrane protein YbhN (UPF0104 family)